MSAIAESDYGEAIKLRPKNHYPYRGRGWIYEKLGQPDAALADYEKALSLAPNDVWVRESMERLAKRNER